MRFGTDGGQDCGSRVLDFVEKAVFLNAMDKEQGTQPTIAVSLTVKDGATALDFYARAFDARELYRMAAPDGSVAHSEFMIGNTLLYLSGESPDWKAFAMPEGATASCLFGITTDDCDAAFKQAVEAGGEPVADPQDYFWGMRTGVIRDPFGYRWSLRQLIEEVSPEEMAKRAKEFFGG